MDEKLRNAMNNAMELTYFSLYSNPKSQRALSSVYNSTIFSDYIPTRFVQTNATRKLLS
jgi:hypothetical protein